MRFSVAFVLALAAVAHADPGVVAAKISKADEAFTEASEKVYASYRKALSDALSGATKIEVYLLDFQTTKAADARVDPAWAMHLPEDQFPIVPYGSTSKILKRKKLTAAEISLLMPSLQATIAVEKNSGGAACHFPVHGVRIWDGDNIVFQTSICHHCMNFYMTYPNGEADWTGLSVPDFRKTMEQLMPIPQTEIDRFDAKYGSK